MIAVNALLIVIVFISFVWVFNCKITLPFVMCCIVVVLG